MAENTAASPVLEWDYVSGTVLPHMSFVMSHLQRYSQEDRELVNHPLFSEFKHINGKMYSGDGSLEIIITGSTAEGLKLSTNFTQIDISTGDVDVMLQLTDPSHFVQDDDWDSHDQDPWFLLETNNVHPGHARIEIINANASNIDGSFTTTLPDSEKIYLDGNKFLHKVFENQDYLGDMNIQGPAITGQDDSPDHLKKGGIDIDHVFTLRVPHWPAVAQEWDMRQRATNWPSPTVVQNIIAKGCNVVSKAHAKSEFMTCEWRLSFSLAEVTLSKELSTTQKKCYILLKMLQSHAFKEPKGIVSYHLKMLLFWAAEEIPMELWTEQSLGEMLVYLLDKLLYCLITKNLPSYFIPSNNLIDTVPDEVISSVKKKVLTIRQDPLKHLLQYCDVYKCFDRLLSSDSSKVFMRVVNHGQKGESVTCSLGMCIADVFIPTLHEFAEHHILDFQDMSSQLQELSSELQDDPESNTYVGLLGSCIRHLDSPIDMAAYIIHLQQQLDSQSLVHPAWYFERRLVAAMKNIHSCQQRQILTMATLCARLLERFPDAPNKEELQEMLIELVTHIQC